MKLSTIAKTSLALGILTTGVITTNAQSVDAAKSNVQNQISVEELKTYYSKTPFELRNVQGEVEGEFVKVIDGVQLNNIKFVGTDKNKLKDLDLSNIDVFGVREGTSKDATNISIGGITKHNSKNYTDYVVKAPITIETKHDVFTLKHGLGTFEIKKDEISLKELDFKLRNKLIKEHGLYSNGKNKGVITVHMKDRNINNDYYSFVLDNKLQEHRMGDVIDATKIDRIDVEFK